MSGSNSPIPAVLIVHVGIVGGFLKASMAPKYHLPYSELWDSPIQEMARSWMSDQRTHWPNGENPFIWEWRCLQGIVGLQWTKLDPTEY